MTQSVYLQFLISCFVFFTLLSSYANNVSPSDEPYYIVEKDGFQYIYPKSQQHIIKKVISYNEFIIKTYEQDFGWKLDEKGSLVIASTKNQTANAFATTVPNVLTTLYSGGPLALENMSSKSWLKTLIFHEVSHLYQLNVKPKPSQFLKSIFGNPNPSASAIALFPYMIHPNLFTPTFMLEGNAVLNESRFDNGGRLFNGATIALANALAQKDLINPNRLINDHNIFPYGREKYLIGGLFNAFLVKKYGIAKTNHFFKVHARNFTFPLTLDKAFQNNFGVGYTSLINEFQESLKTKSVNSIHANESPLFKTTILSPLNRTGKSIYFLNFKNAKSKADLIKLGNDGTIKLKKATYLPNGRIFAFKGPKYYSATNYQISPTEIRTSLISEDLKANKKFLNKLLFGKQGKHVLYADLNDSFETPKIFKNKTRLTQCHSRPMLDKQSNTYCFSQEGKKRTLYFNNEALFSFKGYSSELSDVLSKNNLYFTAPSIYGNSLYQWKNNKILRVHNSDFIVDAKIIDSNKALIVEVRSDGYEYKVSQLILSPKQVDPYEISYAFEEENTAKPILTTKVKDDILQTENSYNSLTQLRFNSFTPFATASSVSGSTFGLPFLFSDPLGFNSLYFSLLTNKDSTDALVSYTNLKHRLSYGLSYLIDQSAVYSGLKKIRNIAKTSYAINTSYPLFKVGLWSGKYGLSYINETDEAIDQSITKEASLINKVTLARYKAYPFAANPYTLFTVDISHLANEETTTSKDKYDTLYGQIKYGHDLGDEWYLEGNYAAISSNSTSAKHELETTSSIVSFKPYLSSVTLISTDKFFKIEKGQIALKKPILENIYPTRFPLGLSRISAAIGYNYFNLAKNKAHDDLSEVTESFYGFDIELLIAHRFKVLLSTRSGQNSLNNKSTLTNLSINKSF